VRESPAAKIFTDPGRHEFRAADLEYAVQVDIFDFVMRVERRAGLLVMQADAGA